MSRAVNLGRGRALKPEVLARLTVGEVLHVMGRVGDAEVVSRGHVTAKSDGEVWATFPRVDRITHWMTPWTGAGDLGHIGWPVAQQAVRKGMTVRVIEAYPNESGVSLLGRVTESTPAWFRVGTHVVHLGRRDQHGRSRSLRVGEHRN
jgi:hypothetical protein